MMSLSVFNFSNSQLNVSMTTYKDNDGGIWFPAIETAELLGYRDPRKAVLRIVRDKNTATFYEIIQNSAKSHGVENIPPRADRVKKLIDEAGFWRLAVKSNAEIAEDFQDWVCGEVLPNIRKQRFYAIPGVLEQINAIKNSDILSLEGDDRKDFRTTSQEKSNLSKDPKAIARGKIGGGVTQERRREMKTKILKLEEENETLSEENDRLFEENEIMSEEMARLTFNESRSNDKIRRLENELDGLRNLAHDQVVTLDYQTEVIKKLETKINSTPDEKPENEESL